MEIETIRLRKAIWALTVTLVLVTLLELLLLAVFYVDMVGFVEEELSESPVKELFLEGDFDSLLQAGNERLETHPNDEYAWFYLGRMYLIQGDFSAAKEHLERALEIDPAWGHAKDLVAEVCAQIDCT